MKTLFIICFAGVLAFESAAQDFTVRNYAVPEGMPSSEVYDVFQDSKGFIWFGTDNGVVRFDGHEMKVYRAAEGLGDPVVFGIVEDHRGRLFFRTFSGQLYIYENERITPYPFNDIITNSGRSPIVMSMHVDSADGLWFSTGTMWGHIDAKGKASLDSVQKHHIFYKRVGQGHLTGKRIRANTYEPFFWIDGKVFRIDYEVFKHFGMNNFASEWKGKLYFTGNNRIYEYDGNSVKHVFSGPAAIIALYKDPLDRLWIGYQAGGIERYENNFLEEPWKPSFVNNKSVSNILYDRDGGLWVTTLENGVYYAPDLSIEHLAYEDSSKVKSVLATDQQLMMGAYSGMFTVLDARTKKTVFKKKFASPVNALFRDSRRNVWVSTEALFFYNEDFEEVQRHSKLNPVLEFVEPTPGRIKAFTSSTCYNFNAGGNLIRARHARKGGFRNMLFEDSVVYISGRLGLHVFDTTHQLKMSPPALANLKISRLIRLNDSTVFAATIGSGIHLINTRTWTSHPVNAETRFIADNIFTAVEKDSTLWLGTEKGIFIVDVRSLVKGDPEFIQITMSNGLIADKVNFIALGKHNAWVFSDESISTIPYSTVRADRAKPVFYLKELSFNKAPVTMHANLELPYDAANISLSFGFLSIRDQDIAARYRLAGSDPWIYMRDRKLQLTSIGPGAYLFEMEYAFDNFHWLPATSFEFTVTPPWWQRWYVQAVAFVVLAGLVYLYIRNYYRRLHEQQQRLIQAEIETLERERNRIAKELHDGVATNLSAIKLMVSQLLRTHNDPLAQDVDEHFMNTITEIKDIIYGLTPPGLERHGLFMGLKNYVDKLNKTIPVRIHLDTTGNDVNKSDLGILTFRIIQELLSNAVKHASAKNIFITMNSDHEQLSIEFRDDGVGFDYDPGKSGLGLANVESRVESVNGNMKFESRTAGVSGASYIINLPLN